MFLSFNGFLFSIFILFCPAHKPAFNLTCHLDVAGQRLRPNKKQSPANKKKQGGGGENLQKNDGLMGQKEASSIWV
jgi:hypothetical protein